jgi:uncharacterized protein (DUF433 family)
MNQTYVEQSKGGYRIAGTRVSLDSVVYAFLNGNSAEGIAQSFPTLTLEQVYGALTYYLANKSDVDSCLEQARSDFETLRRETQKKDPMFYRKLAASSEKQLAGS